ncbi:major capsid protein [Desulfovibrio sulfodismutans]|uniref:Major capsid protein n=1 Tax=Desulfolutivibrio sulfodismutans TaxID=63561 RepID=A0A7K3NLE0_9BACT|nr:major capsid protein [Desulfolutivibrio sulfodismutans]NDY56663.1 major capsid protein [Desulfolutivibrio sulfodismutans]QLA11237.1 major capsid protein [Desulfolutivibrio sulfodismutans DSM 3696]
MPNEIDLFSSREMLEVVETVYPVGDFLLETFFHFSDPVVHISEYVDVDVVKGGRRLAAFVNPLSEGKPVERKGYSTKTLIPPYVKPFRITTAGDLLKRLPGEHVYGGKSPQERAAYQLGRDLLDLMTQINRRIGWMAAQILNTGKVVCVGEDISLEVDFGLADTHKITLSAADKWTASTADPAGDIVEWKDLLAKDSGHVPDVAVLGLSVAQALKKNELVLKQLDNRRVIMGQIVPQDLPKGVTYLGELEGVQLYQFLDYYEDDSGVLQPMVPANKILIGSTRAEARMHFGAIKDAKAMIEGVSTPYYPSSWIPDNPPARHLMIQSAPLPAIHEIDAFASILAV